MRHYEERWATIRFDDSVHAVWVEWKSYAEGEQYRSALEAMVELLRQKKSSRLLADCRHIGPVTQADQQWSNLDWRPRAIGAGLRWIAIVAPRPKSPPRGGFPSGGTACLHPAIAPLAPPSN